MLSKVPCLQPASLEACLHQAESFQLLPAFNEPHMLYSSGQNHDLFSCRLRGGKLTRAHMCLPQQQSHLPILQAQARRIDETRMRLSDQERRDRAQQLQRTMLLLVHASNCKDANCSSSHCGKVKNLFHHAATCQKKIAGGCPLCRCVTSVMIWG